MKREFRILMLILLALAAVVSVVSISPMPALAEGVTQISGIAYPGDPALCTDDEGAGSDFILALTGDLEGCHYVFVDYATCTPSGVYIEAGTETFVGEYNGQHGTFQTTYKFEAKYKDCPGLVDEVFGRCQHPITVGSGKGVFEGVTGRLDFKDDVVAVEFPYRGHLKF
jgi:hypothetical protein